MGKFFYENQAHKVNLPKMGKCFATIVVQSHWSRNCDWLSCLTYGQSRRHRQGRIKGGATGEIAPGPPLQEGPRDEIYLFQIKCSFEKFSWFWSDSRIQLYIIYLCCVKHQGSPTATDFSASLTVCQF